MYDVINISVNFPSLFLKTLSKQKYNFNTKEEGRVLLLAVKQRRRILLTISITSQFCKLPQAEVDASLNSKLLHSLTVSDCQKTDAAKP